MTGRPGAPTATAAALLAYRNLVVPRLPPGTGPRTATNLAAGLALLSAARRGGLAWAELGLSRAQARAGVRAGSLAFTACCAGYGVALALPGGRRALASGAARRPRTPVLHQVAVHIPLGTVVAEELAFRGVLHALAERTVPPRVALALTSVVFAVWHLGPAAEPPPESPLGTLAVTGAGGLAFGLLRRYTGSLLAPAGLHLGTNAGGALAAALTRR